MTISTTANRQDFTGDGCTKAFGYTFKLPAAADLDALVGTAQKTLTTDYSVSGVGSETGGTVTFVSAPAAGVPVALIRDVSYTQGTDLGEGDALPVEALEDALDKLTMLVQQIKEFATRSWRFAAGSVRAAAGYTVDEPKALTYPRVKSDCTGIEFVTLTACGTYADPVTTKGDLIVGSASGTQERLGITSGYTLVADPNTGRPSWQPGLMGELTNTADAALTAGDVVAVAANCDRAVVVNDIQGCTATFVVTPAAVGDDCLALFHVRGVIRNVKAQGAILRGAYVRKSATSKAVESTGVLQGAASAPIGTLGVAVTAAAGGFVDVEWWGVSVTSRVTGTVNALAKFGSSCELSTSVVSEDGTCVTMTLPLALPAAGSNPQPFGVYRGMAAQAVGNIVWVGGQPALSYGVNTLGLTDDGTGTVGVTLDRDFTCTGYVLVAMAVVPVSDNLYVHGESKAVGSFVLQVTNENGTLVDPDSVAFAAWGPQ